MTSQEFAKRIREKYPDGVASDGVRYTDMEDDELTLRIIKKYPVYRPQVDLEPNLIGSPAGAARDLAEGVSRSFSERTEAAASEQERAIEGEISPLRATLRTVGQGAGAVGDVAFEVLKLFTPKVIEDLTAKGVEKVSETEVAQSLGEKYAAFKERHPEAVKDLESVVNIGALLPVGKAAQLAGKGAAAATKTVSRITGEALEARRVARIDQAKQEIGSVVGKIVQGKKADIEQARRALSSLDTRDVKTYQDLKEKIDDGVEALAQTLDDHLERAGSGATFKPANLVTETKVGATTVKQRFVDDALGQLKELYRVTKDAPALARIQDIEKRYRAAGLSLKELNDLAREYGREFGNKAFSKTTGDPLTSVQAPAFENTRKGIKDIVRSKMPDDTAKMLDQRMSDLINTNRLVKKMEERVNALYQRAKKRGVLERAARSLADVVDAATFGTISGFVSRLLPSNVGLKVMNAIDLENALNTNLKKLDRLLETTSDKELIDGIIELVRRQATPAQ